MTEKQFYIDTIDGGGSVLTENGVELGLYETCDLLNEFYKKKEQLKSENQRLKRLVEELNIELTEIKQSEEDNYNIADGLW